MCDLGNPDVPRSWADASEDLYSPISVSLSLSEEAGLSTNEDTHMEVNPSSALPFASSCGLLPGTVLALMADPLLLVHLSRDLFSLALRKITSTRTMSLRIDLALPFLP